MAVLSGEQIAQIAYQAGFRGEVLAQMVGIARRESGWKSDAWRTDNPGGNTGDVGLWQINIGANLRSLNAIGITSPQQLLDPVTNARAAYFLYQRDGLYPWSKWSQRADGSWYASGPPTWNVNMSVARAAVESAQSRGMLGQPYQGGSGATQTLTGGPATSPTGAVQLPSDTRIVNVGYNIFAIYDVGNGLKLAYTVNTAAGAVAWKQHSTGIQAMTQDQFNQQGYIMAGDAAELGTVSETFGTFKSFWDSILGRIMGPTNPARHDPEVQRVMAEFAARPDMDLTELQNKLQATKWYQEHTTAELEWNGLAAAEQDKRREETKNRAADTWFQVAGERLDPTDPRIANYLEQLASGKMGWGAYTQIVQAQARLNPESPFSRETRSEQEAQRQRGIDIENTAQNIRDTLNRWGLSWTDSMIQDWAHRIVEKVSSDDDLMNAVKQQASVLYPWKDPELETLQAAQPWLQVYERRMEKVGSLQNPQIQAALTAGQTPWDFEKQLKSSTAWLGTRNGREEMFETGFEVAKRMGFS